MKQLQLSPPLLIITMGYPGSGKTFFSRQFADQYKIARVSEDRVRFELFERPLFNEDEADIIERMMFYTLEQLMQTGQTIVCEGASSTVAKRRALDTLAKNNGYRTLIVWLQADNETSLVRATNRDRRNPDSKYAFEIDESTFNALKAELERPGEKESFVVVSGKHAFKSQCLTVLKKITTTYSESLISGKTTVQPTTVRTPQVRRSNQRFIQ